MGQVGQWPTWSDDGELLTFTAQGRIGDPGIFFVRTREPRRNHRLSRLPGLEVLPVVRPGTTTIFFGHAAGLSVDPARPENWVIYRQGWNEGARTQHVPELVADGLSRLGRLSFFPDGDSLLVWSASGMELLNVQAGTREPFDLPELHDPDLPGGPPLKMREPAASPDGNRLAFSGYRDAVDGEDGTGWYIHVCNLDGSDLRRVTPLEDEPVPPYVFPETGKTAFDVAREIALERLNADR